MGGGGRTPSKTVKSVANEQNCTKGEKNRGQNQVTSRTEVASVKRRYYPARTSDKTGGKSGGG